MVVKNENSNPPEKNLRVTRNKEDRKRIPDQSIGTYYRKILGGRSGSSFVGDTLYVYFDKYRDHRYGAVRSLDYGETWEDVSDQVFFSEGDSSWNGVCGGCLHCGVTDCRPEL